MNNENKRKPTAVDNLLPWSNGCSRKSGGSPQRNDLEPLSLSTRVPQSGSPNKDQQHLIKI
jgi:hypothetical protein